ncbi:MAG TPA: 16S rRNA (guanine(527)-N(7))-methyltransferase RsmG, partial [Ruminiclostridium sp.]|nr:16S rRNA (guanine(527)-N(7))-methyltransferase RsmG [Ruminiclostridium sp.]
MLSEQNLSLLKESAEHYGLNIAPGQLEKFSKYAELLTEWNEKINLTAIIDPEGIVIKHFSDSLSIMPLIPREAKTFIDIGTGAGFPGIPLKIMQDHLKVTLLDSLGKRVKFLNEVCEKLSLKGIESFHGRAEDYGTDKNYREKYDVASARAVASL